MLKIVCIILCIIFEIPFVFKYIQAKNNYDITRQTAVLILMFIVAAIFFGIYKLGLFVVG